MKTSDKVFAEKIYLFLSTLFITSLVVSNIIFQKFFYWYPIDFSLFGQPLFEISVGYKKLEKTLFFLILIGLSVDKMFFWGMDFIALK